MKSETLVLVITDLNIFLSVLFNTDSMSKWKSVIAAELQHIVLED